MAWATREDLEKDLNIDFSTITRVDNDMVDSQIKKAKGLILGIIGQQWEDVDVDDTLWAIHLEVSARVLYQKLNQIGVRGYEAPDELLTDDDLLVLNTYLNKEEQDMAIETPFADELPEESGYGTDFWFYEDF